MNGPEGDTPRRFPFLPALPGLPAPTRMLTLVVNAMLDREPWARDRLATHAGQCVRVIAAGQPVALRIETDGKVASADPDTVADVTLTLDLSRISLTSLIRADAAGRAAAITRLTHIQGDAALARTVSELAEHLRWDVEAELASHVGDIAAHRIVDGARGLTGALRHQVTSLADNVIDYLTQEQPALVAKQARDDWARRATDTVGQLDALGARMDALAARLERLQQRR